jgi:regulator of cell morphogenesis and NO signaling
MAMVHGDSFSAHVGSRVLDVRNLAPRFRHPMIFETFDALRPGDSFVLVNDHDPKPLLYQFKFERSDAFGWRYLEEGPEVWSVEITKTAGADAVTPAMTVAAVTQRWPQVLPVLQRLGINHCCGAHLNLAEAAATAGLDPTELVRALDDAIAGHAAKA